MLGRLSRTIAGLVTLPPTLAHEGIHAIAASPWADELALVVDARGVDAAVGVDWTDDDPPTYAVWLTAYAPAVLGALAGIWGVLRLSSEGVPREPTSLAVLGVVAIWWAIFMWPSGSDRQRAAEARQEDTDAKQA